MGVEWDGALRFIPGRDDGASKTPVGRLWITAAAARVYHRMWEFGIASAKRKRYQQGVMNRRNFIGISTLAVSLAKVRGAEGGGPPDLSFGLITDVQYADADPQGERHYRESIPKLKTAVEWLAKKKLPFTLHLGDLIDRDFKSFATVMPLFDGLGHQVRHLLGNHDYSVTDEEKGRILQKPGCRANTYEFGTPACDSSCSIPTIFPPTKSGRQPAGSGSGGGAEETRRAKRQQRQAWNGGISENQLKWLDAELTAADTAKERVILCGHHPLLPSGCTRCGIPRRCSP